MDADLFGLKRSNLASGKRAARGPGKEELPRRPKPAGTPTAREKGERGGAWDLGMPWAQEGTTKVALIPVDFLCRWGGDGFLPSQCASRPSRFNMANSMGVKLGSLLGACVPPKHMTLFGVTCDWGTGSGSRPHFPDRSLCENQRSVNPAHRCLHSHEPSAPHREGHTVPGSPSWCGRTVAGRGPGL